MPELSVRTALRYLRQAPEGDDAELLRHALCERDEAALAELVRRHGPMVLGVCRRLLRDEHDAEDAFQATFLVLVRKAGSLRGALGGWLHEVAYRTALAARRAGAAATARGACHDDTGGGRCA